METGNQKYLDYKIVNNYKKIVIDMLRYSYPELAYSHIEAAVDMSIIKRMKHGDAVLKNNYKNKEIDIRLIDMAEYIMQREPIMTSYGVIFKKHDEDINPIAKMLQAFMDNRGIYKNKMFEYPKGSELYNRYNMLQLLAKLDARPITV